MYIGLYRETVGYQWFFNWLQKNARMQIYKALLDTETILPDICCVVHDAHLHVRELRNIVIVDVHAK